MTLTSTITRPQYILLFVLAAINFTHIMDFMIMMPLGPQLMDKLQINPQQFSLLVASYSVSAGIASFIGTFVVDRFDRKKVLMLCYPGFCIGSIICGLSPDYSSLLSARILTGLLGGVIGSQVLSIVADVIPAQHRGKATGTVMTGFSVASVVGVPVGQYFGTKMGWEVPFFGIGLVGLAIWVAALIILPPVREHLKAGKTTRNPITALKKILSFRSHQLALIFTLLVTFSHFTIVPFLSPYMVSNVGFKQLDLSYIYIFGGTLTLFTGPYIGKLADQFGTVKVFSILVLVAFIPQIAITNMPPVPIWVALVATSMFFIFSGGRFVPSQSLTMSAIDPAYRGGFMSLNSSLMQMASGLAVFLAGLVVVKNDLDQLEHYNLLGYSTVIFSILTIFMARKLKS